MLACDQAERVVGVADALSDGPRIEPTASGIQHVVLVMMENRSFDHFLGWRKRADGIQAGLTYTDAAGVAHPTHALAPI